jgi:hypothetical protein
LEWVTGIEPALSVWESCRGWGYAACPDRLSGQGVAWSGPAVAVPMAG